MKSCWLLETAIPGYLNPVYISVFGHMTSDPRQARRFETEVEAQAFRTEVHVVGLWKAVRHVFDEVTSGSENNQVGQPE